MDYLHDSAGSIYRRRRRRRMVVTMTCVLALLLGTVLYAASYIQGWAGIRTTDAVASTSCTQVTASQSLTPAGVTINVYNSTSRTGLAASAAASLRRQGFKVATVDNDPLGKSIPAAGEIRYGAAGLQSAHLAALRLPQATLVQDGRMDASVDFVLGNTFKAVKVPPKIAISVKATSTPHC